MGGGESKEEIMREMEYTSAVRANPRKYALIDWHEQMNRPYDQSRDDWRRKQELQQGYNTLHFFEITELLKNGADINAPDRKYNTFIELTINSRRLDGPGPLGRFGAFAKALIDGGVTMDQILEELDFPVLLVAPQLIPMIDMKKRYGYSQNRFIEMIYEHSRGDRYEEHYCKLANKIPRSHACEIMVKCIQLGSDLPRRHSGSRDEYYRLERYYKNKCQQEGAVVQPSASSGTIADTSEEGCAS